VAVLLVAVIVLGVLPAETIDATLRSAGTLVRTMTPLAER
jgi:hypothetical protein